MATRDYTLGKGKVLFKKSGDAAYLDLGNAPAFTVNVTIDKIEHFSSRAGLAKKDLEVITKLGMGGSFTLDEPNAKNLAMFFMSTGTTATTQGANASPTIADIDLVDSTCLGAWFPIYETGSETKTVNAAVKQSGSGTSTLTSGGTPGAGCTASRTYEVICQTSGSPDTFMWRRDVGAWTLAVSVTGAAQTLEDGITITFSSTTDSAQGDRWTFTVDVTPAASKRVYNLDPSSVATVTDGTNTLTAGVDGVGHYQIDYTAGLIYINPNQPVLYPLDGSETLVLTTIDLLAGAKQTTTGGTLTSLKGDLYFVGDPPQGRIVDLMGFCSLTPNGDFALVGEDWLQVQFNVEFLEVEGVSGLISVVDRGKAGTL